MKKYWISLGFVLIAAVSFFWIQHRSRPLAPDALDEAQLRAHDLRILDGENAESPDLRAALGRHLKRDPEKAINYSRKWLAKYPQDEVLREMLLLASLDVPKVQGLQIVDDLLADLKTPRLVELRYDIRSKLDAEGTAAELKTQKALSPRLSFVLYESGDRSPELQQKLLQFAKTTSNDDVLVLRVFKTLIADDKISSELSTIAQERLSSSDTSPDLRVALYRLLESRRQVFLKEDFVAKMLASLPESNKIQMIRALAQRCRGDRAKILENLAKTSADPLRSTARDVIAGLKSYDPCR